MKSIACEKCGANRARVEVYAEIWREWQIGVLTGCDEYMESVVSDTKHIETEEEHLLCFTCCIEKFGTGCMDEVEAGDRRDEPVGSD